MSLMVSLETMKVKAVHVCVGTSSGLRPAILNIVCVSDASSCREGERLESAELRNRVQGIAQTLIVNSLTPFHESRGPGEP